MPTFLVAAIDMRGNLFAAAIILVIGALLLRSIHSNSATPYQRRWIPIVAFICGPIWALGWFVIDCIWISPYDYRTAFDYFEKLLPILIIGTIGGAMGSGVLWLAERLFQRNAQI